MSFVLKSRFSSYLYNKNFENCINYKYNERQNRMQENITKKYQAENSS